MKTISKAPILWMLTLLLAACGSTSTTGGTDTNQPPEAGVKLENGTALGAASYVSPTQAVIFTASDPDGSVSKLKWVIDAGQPLERSGEFTGTAIKSKLAFQLPGLNSGAHTLSLTVTDNLGATGNSVANFKVDASVPVVGAVTVNGIAVVAGAALTFKSGDSVSLTASATDSRGAGDTSVSIPSVAVYLGETMLKSSSTGSVTADLSSLLSASAVNLVRVVATDSVGNVSTVRTLTFASAAALTVSLTAPVEGQQVEQLLTLRASATNSSSVSQVEFFVNGSSVGVDTTPADGFTTIWDTSKVANGTAKVYAVVTDTAGNSATSPTVQVTVTNRPKVAISNAAALADGSADGTANGNISGFVSVNVTATDLGGVTQVDLFANDQKVATLTSSPYNFALDTTKYPNGAVVLFARATNATGQTSDTAKVTLNALNSVAPALAISSPATGGTVTAPSLPVQITINKRNSTFAVTNNVVTLDLLDYRGQRVDSKVVTVSDDVSGVYTSAAFDLAKLPADTYTIRARMSVSLDTGTATATLTTIETVSQITTNTSSINPPAAVVRLPISLANGKNATITSGSGFLVNVSDNTGVDYVQVRFVNKDGTPLNNAYLLNEGFPAPKPLFTDVVIPNLDIDGSQYVPDGDYFLRVTVADIDGNRNIQEVPVTVKRGAITNYTQSVVTNPTSPNQAAGAFTYSSGTWTLIGVSSTSASRIIAVLYKNGTVVSTQLNPNANGNQSFTTSFGEAGTYELDWILEDLTTGVSTYVNGTPVSVSKNP